MTRVLHTARISNVEFIKFIVNNKDGKFFVSDYTPSVEVNFFLCLNKCFSLCTSR